MVATSDLLSGKLMNNGRSLRVFLLCLLLLGISSNAFATSDRGAAPIRQGAPFFVRQSVIQSLSLFAPGTKVEYVILWNGDDIHGMAFPPGTMATLKLDGTISSYLVVRSKPLTLFLSNVQHKFALVTNAESSARLSSAIVVVTPLDLSLPEVVPAAELALKLPNMQCDGSAATFGIHPGWSSPEAAHLTSVDFGVGSHAIFWCPAGSQAVSGAISYTVTTRSNGYSCETTTTSCIILGSGGVQSYQLMASDLTGTYSSGLSTIQNSGTIAPCIPAPQICNISKELLTFPSYGNVAPLTLGDCTFAAIANWEQITLGVIPDPTLLGLEFGEAGGTKTTGLSDLQAISYWQNFGVTGTSIAAAVPVDSLPESIRSSIDKVSVQALIASLHLRSGQYVGNVGATQESFHWVVVDGYTPRGPLVVTWGQTIQMTWQQWSQEIDTAWQIELPSGVSSTQ